MAVQWLFLALLPWAAHAQLLFGNRSTLEELAKVQKRRADVSLKIGTSPLLVVSSGFRRTRQFQTVPWGKQVPFHLEGQGNEEARAPPKRKELVYVVCM